MVFSIIIPTYNRASLIEQTIHSLLTQSYSEFEIIVVDDGSTDNTEQVVTSISDRRISYYKKANEERGVARNFGVSKANGDYVNFFDSDDLAYPNHLSTALQFIQENNTPEVFHLNYEFKNSTTNVFSKSPLISNINSQILKGNILSCNGVFMRKDIALGNPFSEDRKLSGTEDYLLWLKLSARYCIHHSSIITSIIVNHENRSVLNFSKAGLIDRANLLIKCLKEDNTFMNKNGSKIKKIYAHMLSYIAIHAALEKERSVALSYLFNAIWVDASQIFTRRTLAIIKRLFI